MLTSRPSRGVRVRGFTLVELLIVIAIIGILIGLLVPVSLSMRQTARKAQCASNMRQIGVAWLIYVNQKNRGRFPETRHVFGFNVENQGHRTWIFTLEPYLENVDSIRLCPEDPEFEQRRHAEDVEDPTIQVLDPESGEMINAKLPKNSTSYAYNDYLDGGIQRNPFNGEIIRHPDAVDRFSRLRKPERSILLFEGRTSTSIYGDHCHATSWFHEGLNLEGTWSFINREIDISRHNGSSNYLYADGHVESFTQQEIRNKVEQGINFAKPGNG